MRAAYDALDDETKAEIEDLVCEHSLMYSRGALGFSTTPTRKGAVQAGAAAARAHASGHRPQVAVSGLACGRHRRHADAGGAAAAARSQGACDATANSSTCTNGRCTISSSGTTARPCTACGATTKASRATCAAPRSRATRRRWRSRRRSRGARSPLPTDTATLPNCSAASARASITGSSPAIGGRRLQ